MTETTDYVVLDVETVASPDCATWLDPVKAPTNYKDPLKIAAYCEEKRNEQITRAGLEADLCEIVALGTWASQDDELRVETRRHHTEKAMIAWAWDAIGYRRVIGFNILTFDLPVLMRRSQYLSVPFPELGLDRYRTPHLDLLERLSFHGRVAMRSLAFYCRRFGIPCDDPVTGADIAGLVAAGDWMAIEQHVRSDIIKTRALAQRLGWVAKEVETC